MVGLAMLAAAAGARATLTAHLQATAIDGGCRVDDQENPFEDDPDRYFRLAIFDDDTSSVLNACATGCSDDGNPATIDGAALQSCVVSTGCGVWNFNDLTLEKVVPPHSGAYFYFGLFDRDDVPADDSLGDHWFFASGPSSSSGADNNNLSLYRPDDPIATVCGRDVGGDGDAANYALAYAAWFEDSTPPVPPPAPVASDDGAPRTWDNDTRLDFTWGPAADPDSGIDRYRYSLWDATAGAWVAFQQPSPFWGGLSVCPAGCGLAFTPVHARQYWFRAGAVNGGFPEVANAVYADSAWTVISVDLMSPVSAFVSPPSTWQRSDFGIATADSDSGSGVASCEWRVVSGGVTTQDWTPRTCNATVTATVGPSGLCRHAGATACSVSLRSTDTARRVSSIVTNAFRIDFSADSVAGLAAFTEAGGEPIPEGTEQPDAMPFMSWVAPTSSAPIDGYSTAWDEAADCTVDVSATSLQVASPLAAGTHVFAVRAIDAAGNCGAAVHFQLWVAAQIFADGFESGDTDAWE